MKKLLIGLLALSSFSVFASDLECTTYNFLSGNVDNANSRIVVKQDDTSSVIVSSNSQADVKVFYTKNVIIIKASDTQTGESLGTAESSANASFIKLWPVKPKTGFLAVSCKKIQINP